MENESQYILEKKIKCPICGIEFPAKQVKTGKARFIGSDDDLRPRYSGIDTIKYDVILCTCCGYAAVSREFTNVTSKQRQNIIDGIANRFCGIENKEGPYTYEDAIYRYKMAILTAMVKPSKLSEGAYLGLKLAWVYKGALEYLNEQENPSPKLLKAYAMGEKYYKEEAYKGLAKALTTEYPPICGMDEVTVSYLMAVLGTYLGDYDNATRYAYDVIGSRSASAKHKSKARDLVDRIKQEKLNAEENKEEQDEEE